MERKRAFEETLSHYAMPSGHLRCLRTDNTLERWMREIRRRARLVGAFPDGKSALMPVAARLRQEAAAQWGTKRCLPMKRRAEVRTIALPTFAKGPHGALWQSTLCNNLPTSPETSKVRKVWTLRRFTRSDCSAVALSPRPATSHGGVCDIAMVEPYRIVLTTAASAQTALVVTLSTCS